MNQINKQTNKQIRQVDTSIYNINYCEYNIDIKNTKEHDTNIGPTRENNLVDWQPPRKEREILLRRSADDDSRRVVQQVLA